MGTVGIHAIHDEFTTATDVVDGVLEDLGTASSLDDNVEAIRVLLVDLGELGSWIGAGEFNVLVACVERPGQIHLQTCRGSNHNVASTVKTEHLSKDLENSQPG